MGRVFGAVVAAAASLVAADAISNLHAPPPGTVSAPVLNANLVPLAMGDTISDGLFPLPGTAFFDFYHYFNLTLFAPANGGGFFLDVSVLSGDVDMYVSTITTTPSWSNYTWSAATDYAHELISINETAACAGVYPCSFFIATTPFMNANSTYTLTAQGWADTVTLQDGLPFNGALATSAIALFNFSSWVPTDASAVLTVSLSARSGEPAAYASLNVGSDTANWPSAASFQFSQIGSGVMTITPASSAFAASGCALGRACPVAITVLAQTALIYEVVASTGSAAAPELLENGVPSAGFVPQGAYRYFAFTTTAANTNISFILTPGSGDPDMTISTTPGPTMASGTWVSAGVGPEIRVIGTNDPAYVDAPAIYYVGVYGWAGNSTFSLVAVEQTPGYAITLLDGQQQVQQTPAGHTFSYFTFNITTDVTQIYSVDFVATPLVGDVDLYVSLNGQFPQAYCAAPNASFANGCAEYAVQQGTYAYSSVGSGVADFVTIPASALMPQPGGQIIVGVFATTRDEHRFVQVAPPSQFTVVGVSGNDALDLIDGIAIVGTVARSSYKYYAYPVTAWGSDIVIAAATVTGSIDLFASETVQRPGPYTNTWNYTASGGVLRRDIINIAWADVLSHCLAGWVGSSSCTIYIAVKGSDFMANGINASYSLVASVAGNPNFPSFLTNGRAVPFALAPQSYAYFYANVNIDPSQSIYLVAQDFSDSGSAMMWAALGAGAGGAGAFPSPANNMHCDYASTDLGGFARIIISPAAVGVERLAGLPDGRALYALNAPAAAAAARETVATSSVAAVPFRGRDATFITRYGGGVDAARALAAPAAARGVGSSSDAGNLQSGPYCSNCPLFVTLGSRSPTQSSQISMLYSAGATFVPLTDDVVTTSVIPVNGTTYFQFEVTAAADVTFTIQQYFGAVTAYVLVQSPVRPYNVPRPSFWQYAINPSTGSDRLLIPASDPQFCHSPDGSSTSFPCTYLVAVSSVDPTRESFFNIVATDDAGAAIVQLTDGEPQDGTVADGAIAYYVIQPTPQGAAPVAPLLFTATTYVGLVQLYVTNLYIPGVTDASMLPGPNQPATYCQWMPTGPILMINVTDPCFDPQLQTYTIAVVGASGLHLESPFTNSFTVQAAANPQLAQKLEFGNPVTNQAIPDNANAVYVFDLPDLVSDVVISATVNYGEVAMLVSKHSPFGAPPTCNQAVSGGQAICTGYTWMSQGMQGAGAFQIPTANPCAPFTGAGMPAPLVNASACTGDWRVGRFWVTVYALTDAEVSVSVQTAGAPQRMSDGQPQLSLTSNVTVCATRNAYGGCSGNRTTWVSASAAYLTFTVPSTLGAHNAFLLLERLCDGDMSGACGTDLRMFVRACAVGTCGIADSYPSWMLSDASFTSSDSLGSLTLPACAGAGGADCVYNVGVYPLCSTVLGAKPGVGCPPSLQRLTLSADTVPERVPADCNIALRACTIPAMDVGLAAAGVRRFSGYAPALAKGQAATSISVSAVACAGDVALFLCTGNSSVCQPPTQPGPGNADVTKYTRASNGVATAAVSLPSSAYYFGVNADAASGNLNPSFEISVAAAGAPVFTLPAASTPTVQRDTNTGATATVSFTAPTIVTPGGAQPSPAPFVFYEAYAFPISTIPLGTHLQTACGVQAFFATYANPQVVAYANALAGSSVTLTGLAAGQNYTVAVVATCGADVCMPANLQSQHIAYSPVLLSPFQPPAPPATSTPQPGASASPSPGAGGNGNPSSGGHGGAIAGGVIGGLLGVAAIGAGWYGYKRWQSGSGTRYTRYNVQGWTSADRDGGLLDRYAGGRQGGADVDSGGVYAPL